MRCVSSHTHTGRKPLLAATAMMALLALSGCSSWMGDKEDPPLPGERISVLSFDQRLQADPALAETALNLPTPVANASWAFAGGSASHSGGSFALSETPRKAWDRDIGNGVSTASPIINTPIVSNGIVYATDSGGNVTALNSDTGKPVWTARIAPSSLADDATGSGLTLAGGQLFATVGYGEVVALDPATGAQAWRVKVGTPLRSAPSSDGQRVFVVTIDNQLLALSAQDGSRLWKHSGIAESTGLLSAPSPAIGPGYVLVAYSSGELYALNVDNGRELWSDSLSGTRRDGGVMAIAAIRGMPALSADGSIAVAISNSGRMVAIDVRSGQRIWDQRIGGNQMPWIAGDTVFVIDNLAQLTAINLRDGRIRWITQLPQWRENNQKQGLIAWYGPVLAGGKLWLTNSLGRLLAYSPVNGSEAAAYKLGETANRPPVVANGTLYTLDDDAELTAWK